MTIGISSIADAGYRVLASTPSESATAAMPGGMEISSGPASALSRSLLLAASFGTSGV